jgi:predicted dehydrogenase
MTTNDSKRDVKVGLWGTGRQGREHRLPALQALDGVRVVALGDIDIASAGEAAELFSRPGTYGNHSTSAGEFSVYDSFDAMLDAGVHAVVICTPHDAHPDDTVNALKRGVAVLCEKPFATDIEEAKRMLRAAEETGLPLASGYPWPGSVTWPSELAADGRFGRIRRAEISWTRADGIPEMPHFWENLETGGVALDLAGHVATTLVSAVDAAPVRVKATGTNHRGRELYGLDFVAEDTMVAKVVFENGVTATLTVSWATGDGNNVAGDKDGAVDEQFTLELHDVRGRLIRHPFLPQKYFGYDPNPEAFRPVLWEGDALPPSSDGDGTIIGPAPHSYVDLMVDGTNNFIRAVKGLEPLHFPPHRVVQAEQLVHYARQSMHQGGTPIDIPA